MLINWAGPPEGKEENWFLDSVMELRLSREARRPSGRVAMQLFSTLNSSKRTELASDCGIESDFNRLYLKVKYKIKVNKYFMQNKFKYID